MSAGEASRAQDLVLVARFGAPHGVKGAIRLKSFTADPLAVEDYSPLCDASGMRLFTLTSARPAGEVLVVTVKEFSSRDDAEKVVNLDLYIPRDRLPEPDDEDEFLHADLIHLRVESRTGELIGRVEAIFNFGAGDILDVSRPGKKNVMIPFVKAIIPTIDLAGGKMICDPPKGLLADEPPPPDWTP